MNIYASEFPTPPYDPNWFLSTIVQSTAGFIAIMAGFQLTRLVTLNSEKRTLEMRLAELETKRHLINDEIKKISRILVRQTIAWFDRDCLKDIVEDPDQDLEELVSKNRSRGDDYENTLDHAREISTLVKRYTVEIDRLFPAPAFPATTEELLISAGMTLTTDLEKRVAVAVSNTMAKSRRNSIGAILGNSLDYIVPLTNERVYQRHDDLISEREAKIEQVGYLEGEMGGLSAQIMNIPTFRSMLHGFIILFYFAIVGIVYPLIEMSHNPTDLDINNRTFILSSYFFGLAWLLAYILSQAKKLLGIQEKFEKIRKK